MGLTKIQKKTILKATADMDYCVIAHGKTMSVLVEKKYANYTNGFGYRYGAIIELTEIGKERWQVKIIIANALLNPVLMGF